MKYKKVTIIGGGKVGCVLGFNLKYSGYEIMSVISRSFASAALCADLLDCKEYSTSIEELNLESDLFLIAVNDTSIKDVVKGMRNIKKLDFNKIAVFHTSGVNSSHLLYPLKAQGAKVFSMHPFQTFVSISSVLDRLEGVYYGIEGTKSVLNIAKRIVNDLKGIPIEIPAKLKPIYHTAGVFASNYLIALIESVNQIFSKLNIPQWEYLKILTPIMNQTLVNVSNNPTYGALTGPIVRGDSDTVELHLNSLAKEIPSLIRFYISMGLETLEASKVSGRINKSQYNNIMKIFIEYLKPESSKEEATR